MYCLGIVLCNIKIRLFNVSIASKVARFHFCNSYINLCTFPLAGHKQKIAK